MKPALSCAFGALMLVACVDAGEVEEAQEVLGPGTHEPTEAAANERQSALPLLTTAATGLQNGVPVSGLAGAQGSLVRFTFEVPAGASKLELVMSGGTGDADLYVRHGFEPTTTQFDHRPYLNGNDESVKPPVTKPGTWHVMIRGYSPYTGASLLASYTAGGPPPPPPVGAPDCTSPASWPADWVAFEDQVLVLVNQRRAVGADCGIYGVKPAVPPLVMDAALRRAARCHSLDMAQQNYFDHNSLDGTSPVDRIRNAGYTGSARGENIAAGQTSAATVVDGWIDSDGHCANVMSDGSNEIGVGYGFGGSSTYQHYWTQDFGER